MPDCQRLGGLSQRGLPTLQSSGALTTRERFARDDVPVYPRGAVTALDTDAREQRFRDSSDCAEDPILNAFTAYDRSMITPVRKRNFGTARITSPKMPGRPKGRSFVQSQRASLINQPIPGGSLPIPSNLHNSLTKLAFGDAVADTDARHRGDRGEPSESARESDSMSALTARANSGSECARLCPIPLSRYPFARFVSFSHSRFWKVRT